MDSSSTFSPLFSTQTLILSVIVTFLCCFFALFLLRSSPFLKSNRIASRGLKRVACNCASSSAKSVGNCDLMAATATATASATYVNGGSGGGGEVLEIVPVVAAPTAPAAERQTGPSMMEQLVPEITTHALSYLDYPSLCRLSMTNSAMRKAANDDNAWKALYHKDFTVEQDTVTPVNGWKAYYAATRAVVNTNASFFNIIRDRSIQGMGHLWLNSDYVKCVHATGEFFTGYDGVMQSWQLAFAWQQQGVEFEIRDVRTRVLPDMAWVTMKARIADMENDPFNVTNIFEFHNGQWYMVHHHCSLMNMVHGPGGGVHQQQQQNNMMLG